MIRHQLDAPNPLNPFWHLRLCQGEHLAVVGAGREVELGGTKLRLRDDALAPGAQVKVWLSTSGFFVCALMQDIERANEESRAAEAVEYAELNARLNTLRAEADAFNAQIKPPVKWAVGIKDVLSGLSERSWGDGHNKATVNHVYLLEPLNSNRLVRKAGDFLCTAAGDSNGKDWSGKKREIRHDGNGDAYQPKVTCKACLKLAKRWSTSADTKGATTSNEEPADLAELPPGCVTLPGHLDGIADAAFRMVEEGECPDNMLKMLKHGLNKSRPQGE